MRHHHLPPLKGVAQVAQWRRSARHLARKHGGARWRSGAFSSDHRPFPDLDHGPLFAVFIGRRDPD